MPLHRGHARLRISSFHSRWRSLPEVVDAALDFGTRGLLKIKTSQVRSEILALAEAVRELQPRIILEIGTARGGNLLLWTHLASQRVITCDLSIPSYRHPLYERFPPPGSACRVTLLEGNSQERQLQQRVRDALGGEPVDFLFIDGDHSEAGVTADWESYRALVRPGGMIALHRIAEWQPLPGKQVAHLWNRIRSEFRTEELIQDPGQCGFGIGVVRV